MMKALNFSLTNLLLKLKFNYFKKYIKAITWDDIPDWEVDWNSEITNPSYIIIQDNMYNGNSYTSKDCVEIKNDGLHLKTIKLTPPEYKEHWSGKFTCYWKCGWIEFHNIFQSYGTWVFKFIPPINTNNNLKTFPAIWFLREPYPSTSKSYECDVNIISNKTFQILNIPIIKPRCNWWVLNEKNSIIGRIDTYNDDLNTITLYDNINCSVNKIKVAVDTITPEVDVMEILGEDYGHTIHFGPSFDEYREFCVGERIGKPIKNKEIEFAVKISKNKYEFYQDGILTCVFDKNKITHSEHLISDQKLFLILNSAVNKEVYNGDFPDFIITSIKYFK